jgi:hypothetical protein
MFKKIVLGALIAAAVIIALFVAIVAMQPSVYHVQRTATMNAAPEAIFAQVNDFHKWDAWSPWLELDPNSKVSFEGPEAGEGAVFRWVGNENVGEGSMTILKSRPYEFVKYRLDFIKPFEDTATSEFILKPEGEQTEVTWAMDGKYNFIGKAICLFMDMDKMIGDNYAEGLENIKRIVEAEPPTPTEPDAQSAPETPSEPETQPAPESQPEPQSSAAETPS